MTYAEKRLIKERSLKKNLHQRLERAKYDFSKEIEKRGGVDNIDSIDSALRDSRDSLAREINSLYDFSKEIEERGGFFENAGDNQARELRNFKNRLDKCVSIDRALRDSRDSLAREINSLIDFLNKC